MPQVDRVEQHPGSTKLWDVYYDDGTAQVVESSTSPTPDSLLRLPIQFVDENGTVQAEIDDTGVLVAAKLQLPFEVVDASDVLVDTITSENDLRPLKKVRVALTGGTDTGAGIGVWQNPEAVGIAIRGLAIRSTHISTGACTMDAGATASTATTVADNLCDGLDLTQAVPNFSSNVNALNQDGANAKAEVYLAPGGWVTFSKASGASAGFTGFGYILYETLN